ncbi:MAG: hypothetical protein QNJ37_22470 [Crocosphaera sp.]|nr:hypothetical protein [Crocosphaera sp.]
MEPTNEQYLIINALDTLELLEGSLYDENTGYWYIRTPSQSLPTAVILPTGDIYPLNWIQENNDNQ